MNNIDKRSTMRQARSISGTAVVKSPFSSFTWKGLKGSVQLRDDILPHGFVGTRFSNGSRIQTISDEDAHRMGPWLCFTFDPELEQTIDARKISGIHRKFASLPFEPKAVASFAKTFGVMGTRNFRLEDDDAFGGPYIIESVNDWYERIAQAKLILQVYDLLPEADRLDPISFQVRVRDLVAELNGHSRPAGPTSLPMLELKGPFLSEELGLIRPSDACRWWICRELTRELRPRCNIEVAGFPAFRLVLMPTLAFGAVLASLVLELTGQEGHPRLCAGCGQWFMAEHGKKKHCSESCKTKASRRRKAALTEETNG